MQGMLKKEISDLSMKCIPLPAIPEACYYAPYCMITAQVSISNKY